MSATPGSELRLDARAVTAGELRPPPSKSDAQRALVIAHALGRPELAPFWPDDARLPDDVRVCARGLLALRGKDEQAAIDCQDGGAPLRFLLGQAAVLPRRTRFTGSPRLGARPHAPLIDSLRAAGVDVTTGSPWPIDVRGVERLDPPLFVVDGKESSQYPSSLLLAAAAASRRDGRPHRVELVGERASPGYLALTLSWLRSSGFAVDERGGTIEVAFRAAPAALPAVPGDWSALGYLLVLAWSTGGRVRDVDRAAEHPDRAIVETLESIGLALTQQDDATRVAGPLPTRGLALSGRDCPDLLPTAAALACALPAASLLSDVEVLRAKESDRVAGIQALVAAAGGSAIHEGGALRIEPPAKIKAEIALDSKGDHRMAMSAAVLAVLGRARLRLTGPECVSKSFPGFWEELARCGVRREA